MRRLLLLVPLLLVALFGVLLIRSRLHDDEVHTVERASPAEESGAPPIDPGTFTPALRGRPAASPAVLANPARERVSESPARIHTFTGRVLERGTDAPIAGAELRILVSKTSRRAVGSAPAEAQGATGTDGSYRFEAALGGDVKYAWCLVRAPFRTSDRGTLDLRVLTHERDFHLSPAGRVEGRTVDEAGAPVPGVRVWMDRWDRKGGGPSAWWEGWSNGVLSGPDGSFRIDGAPYQDRIVVRARAPGYVRGASRPLHVDRGTPLVTGVEVRLFEPGDVTGRILRPAGTAWAWPDGKVVLVSHDLSPVETRYQEQYLDEKGAFEFLLVPSGTYALEFLPHDLEEPCVLVPRIRVPPGETVSLGDLVHGGAHSIAGRVVLREGDPDDLDGVRLLVWSGARSFETRVRPDGAFLFPTVEAGLWRLDVAEDEYATADPIVVEAGTTGLIVEVIRATASIHLRVLDAPTSVNEETGLVGELHLVRHGVPDARTWRSIEGEGGEFLSRDPLPAGTYDLLLEVVGRAFWRKDRVELKSGETLSLEVRLGKAPRLKRRIVDEEGAPIPSARGLLVYESDYPTGPMSLSNRERVYAEWHTDDAGVFDVPIERPDLYLMIDVGGTYRFHERVSDLPPGDVVIGPGWSVRGQLVDAAGAGVADIRYVLDLPGRESRPLSGREGALRRAGTSGANGVFVLDVVPPGTWRLQVFNHGGVVIREIPVEVLGASVDVGAIRVTAR